jgi:hypothetical protein
MVCGDKLALVASLMLDYDNLVYFYLWDLDSPEGRPPWWSPAADLDCEVFISGAHGRLVFYDGRYRRSAGSRANPERWGGRRGLVAYAALSDELFPFDSRVVLPSWVTPGVLSSMVRTASCCAFWFVIAIAILLDRSASFSVPVHSSWCFG